MDGGISIGAVGAALIAGTVSLLGLIISKEQKTSEFRQAWVDALRSEIISYLSSFNAIADAVQVKYTDHAEKVKALAPLYSKLNEASFAITLRVNPDEGHSKAVLACMKKFMQLAANDSSMTPDNIRPIEFDLLKSSKDLLKYEWKRVKRGELTFVMTKIFAGALIIAALWYWLAADHKGEADKSGLDSKATVINNASSELRQVIPPAASSISCPASTSRPVSNGYPKGGASDRGRRKDPMHPALSRRQHTVPVPPALSGIKPDPSGTCVSDKPAQQASSTELSTNAN